MGFGHLLASLNLGINCNVNELLDAGAWSNMQGGLYSKQLKVGGGTIEIKRGHWEPVDAPIEDLAKGFFTPPYKEPSMALFHLVEFLVGAGEKLSSVGGAMVGEQPTPNTPAASVLAQIEQGMKVFGSIFKRIYLSLKAELTRIAQLNSMHLSDEMYNRVLDDPRGMVPVKEDYQPLDFDISPVADPSQATDIQRMARAEALKQTIGGPGINDYEVMHEYLIALKVPEETLQRIHPPQQPPPPPPPDPRMEKIKADFEIKTQELQLERESLSAELRNLESETILNIAKAEAEELGPQLEIYKAQAAALGNVLKGLEGGRNGAKQGAGSRVDSGSSNGGSVPSAAEKAAKQAALAGLSKLGGIASQGNGVS
jgi:hypothetical protein